MLCAGTEMPGSQTEAQGNETSHSSELTMLKQKLKEVGVTRLSQKRR